MGICSSAIMIQRGAGVCYLNGKIIPGEEEKKVTTLMWILPIQRKKYSL